MKWLFPIMTVAALSVAARAPAEQPALSRTELQRHDLSIRGREALQVRVDFPPGAMAPRHTHPGEEIIYVLSGTLDYPIGDGAWLTLRAGDVLFVPAGVVHTARNVSADPASELATYIVEKGQPLIALAP